jgi:hypothetical protein
MYMTRTRKMRRGGAGAKFTFALPGTPITQGYKIGLGSTSMFKKVKSKSRSRSPPISSSGKRLMPMNNSRNHKREPTK